MRRIRPHGAASRHTFFYLQSLRTIFAPPCLQGCMKFLKRHLSYMLAISVQNLEIRYISSVKISTRSSASKFVARTTSWPASRRKSDGRASSPAAPVSHATHLPTCHSDTGRLPLCQATTPRASPSPVRDLV